MKSDLQNKLFGVMHTDMVQLPSFSPTIEVGGGISLLDQMDRAFMRDTMQKHAMMASRLLASMTDEEPVKLESFVSDLSKLKLVQNIDQKDPDSLTLAVASAAIMTSAREGSQTALEKMEGALKLLSDRYQADW